MAFTHGQPVFGNTLKLQNILGVITAMPFSKPYAGFCLITAVFGDNFTENKKCPFILLLTQLA
jgi:hypothetical protein